MIVYSNILFNGTPTSLIVWKGTFMNALRKEVSAILLSDTQTQRVISNQLIPDIIEPLQNLEEQKCITPDCYSDAGCKADAIVLLVEPLLIELREIVDASQVATTKEQVEGVKELLKNISEYALKMVQEIEEDEKSGNYEFISDEKEKDDKKKLVL